MRFDNEFAAIEEGAVEVENNELHWNDSDGWITEQNPRLLVFREVITSNIIRLSTNVGIGSKAPALTVGRSLPVYPDNRTFSAPVGMSQKWQRRESSPRIQLGRLRIFAMFSRAILTFFSFLGS
jgi:hypothetical protein